MKYHAVIRSEYRTDPGLTLGVATLPANGLRGEILVMAHTCHPMQANDDASGVAVVVEVARRLASDPMPVPHMGVRFLFCPETIGSICYLSQHPEVVSNTKAGIYVEMAGTRGELKLQRSYPEGNKIDRVAQYAMRKKFGPRVITSPFRTQAGNDEMVLNGPGLNIPCISLQRWPYPEYHTSDDTPDIILPDKLAEMADVVEETVRVFCTDYKPDRRFTGPIFLSGYGLFGDDGLSVYDREMIMLRLDDKHTVFEIAEEISRDYWVVRAFCDELKLKGLVRV